MANEHSIIWVDQPQTHRGWPVFREEVFRGALTEALDYAVSLATGASFVAGQVLAQDGRILATVAREGRLRHD